MNKSLIYDLGFYNGDDTDLFLRKGFVVVAVEANPFKYPSGTMVEFFHGYMLLVIKNINWSINPIML